MPSIVESGCAFLHTSHGYNTHQPAGETDVVNLHSDVFFEWIRGSNRTRLSKGEIKQGLQLANIDLFSWLSQLSTGELKEVCKEVGPVKEEVVFEGAQTCWEGVCSKEERKKRFVGVGVSRIDVIKETGERLAYRSGAGMLSILL